jgi:hypothetical protein
MVQLDNFEDFYEKAVALYRSNPSRVSSRQHVYSLFPGLLSSQGLHDIRLT